MTVPVARAKTTVPVTIVSVTTPAHVLQEKQDPAVKLVSRLRTRQTTIACMVLLMTYSYHVQYKCM